VLEWFYLPRSEGRLEDQRRLAMRVKVLLFAFLRDRSGFEEVMLEVPRGTRVAELPGKIFPQDGLRPDDWGRIRYAVNLEYVASSRGLRDGDEVALIPPVAGG